LVAKTHVCPFQVNESQILEEFHQWPKHSLRQDQVELHKQLTHIKQVQVPSYQLPGVFRLNICLIDFPQAMIFNFYGNKKPFKFFLFFFNF